MNLNDIFVFVKKNNSCVDQRHIIVYILVKVYILFDVCILKKNIYMYYKYT